MTKVAVKVTGQPDPVDEGQTILHTIVVTNEGNAEAVDIDLTNISPTGTDLAIAPIAKPPWVCTGQGIVECKRPSLAPGASSQVQIAARTKATTPSPAIDTVTVKAANAAQVMDTATTTVRRASADVDDACTATSSQVIQGQPVGLGCGGSNRSQGTARTCTSTCQIPNSTNLTGSCSQGTFSAAGNTGTCNLGDICPGCAYNMSCNATADGVGPQTLHGQITCQNDNNAANDKSDVAVQYNPGSTDVNFDCTAASNQVTLSQPIGLRCNGADRGLVSATGCTATCTMQNSTNVTGSCGPGGTFSAAGNTGTCRYSDICPGCTVNMACDATANAVGPQILRGQITCQQTDTDPANNMSTVTTTVSKAATTLEVTSSGNPSVFGQPVTLTVTVKAVAPGAGTPTGKVTLGDNNQNIIGSGLLDASGKVTFTKSDFPVGSNFVSVIYEGDTNFLGQAASLTQTVNAAPTTLTVTKTGPATATAGGKLTYTLTVMNNGQAPATNVGVTDSLPSGTTFDSSSEVTCTAQGGAVNCGALSPSLAPGASLSLTITVRTDANTPSPVTNTATARADNAPQATSNSSTTSLSPAPTTLALGLTGDATGTAGNTFNYVATLANTGAADASNVKVTITASAGVNLSGTTPGVTCTPNPAGDTLECFLALAAAGSQTNISIAAQTTTSTQSPVTINANAGAPNAQTVTATPVSTTLNPPAPVITSISPNMACAGDRDTKVTITGMNLAPSGSVSVLGPSPFNATITFADSTSVMFTIPASVLANPGNLTILYFNSISNSSNSVQFMVKPCVPTLVSINPVNGVQAQTFPIVLIGTHFFAPLTINAGTGATLIGIIVVSGTEADATFNIAANAPVGTQNVTVTTAGGTSNALPFKFLEPVKVSGSAQQTPGCVNQPYLSGDFSASGGNPMLGTAALIYDFSITTGRLPQGLKLNGSADGSRFFFDGTPTETGMFTITLQASDRDFPTPHTGNLEITININNCNLPTASFTCTPDATTSLKINCDASASTNATTFNWNFGDGGNGTGVITFHTYSAGGIFPIQLTVTNAAGDTASTTQTQTVNNPSPIIAMLSQTTLVAGSGNITIIVTGTGFVVGVTKLQVNGVDHAATVDSATQTTLILTSQELATAGTLNITAMNGTPGGGTSNTATVNVVNSLTIGAQTPADGCVGQTYVAFSEGASTALEVRGGTFGYRANVVAGALPDGITIGIGAGSFEAQLFFSGIPTTAGTFTFTVEVTDSTPPPAGPLRVRRDFTLTIRDCTPAPACTVGLFNGKYAGLVEGTVGGGAAGGIADVTFNGDGTGVLNNLQIIGGIPISNRSAGGFILTFKVDPATCGLALDIPGIGPFSGFGTRDSKRAYVLSNIQFFTLADPRIVIQLEKQNSPDFTVQASLDGKRLLINNGAGTIGSPGSPQGPGALKKIVLFNAVNGQGTGPVSVNFLGRTYPANDSLTFNPPIPTNGLGTTTDSLGATAQPPPGFPALTFDVGSYAIVDATKTFSTFFDSQSVANAVIVPGAALTSLPSGDYVITLTGVSTDANRNSTNGVLRLNFDSTNGTVTGELIENLPGFVSPTRTPVAGTFVANASGGFDLTLNTTGPSFRGGTCLVDNKVPPGIHCVEAGQRDRTQPAAPLVRAGRGKPQAAGPFTAASVAGDYIVTSEFDLAVGDIATRPFTLLKVNLQADGTGTGTALQNTPTSSTSTPITLTYAITDATTGAIDVTISGLGAAPVNLTGFAVNSSEIDLIPKGTLNAANAAGLGGFSVWVR